MFGKSSKVNKAHKDAAGLLPGHEMVGVRPAEVRRHARFSKTAATAEQAFFDLHDDIAKVERMENFFVVSSSHHIIEIPEGFLATALVVFTAEQEQHH
jgi:hypothetical protein